MNILTRLWRQQIADDVPPGQDEYRVAMDRLFQKHSASPPSLVVVDPRFTPDFKLVSGMWERETFFTLKPWWD